MTIMLRFKPLIPLLLCLGFFSASVWAQILPQPSAPESDVEAEEEVESVPSPSYDDWDPITANRGLREWPEDPVVYLIPVRQGIMHPQLFLLRRGIQQAVDAEADAIVLLMDTPGGRVDVMQDMVGPIIDLDIPTYTLVESEEHGAISAGAIIAMATDYIYMKPRARIGDAMPVMSSPGGGGYQTMGEAEREKIESYMDAVVRSIAQAKGRDEMMIRAMVRRELDYTLENGRVVSPAGNILTLTAMEAARPRPDGTPLLSEGTVDDLDAMLDLVGLANAERIELETTWADDLALWITRLAPLFMTGAFLLFYLELNSPGIGWMGGLAVALFLVVLLGHNVAGLAGSEDILLLVLGMVLILVELLVLPGFGFAGLTGIVLMIWGLIQAMIYRYPGNPGDLPGLDNFANVGPAITNLGISIIASSIGMAFLLRSLGESGFLGKRLVLADQVIPEPADTSRADRKALVGGEGMAVTPLTPSGTVRVGSEEHDAVSDSEYLNMGTFVRILDIRGSRLVVTQTSSSTEKASS